MDIMKILEKSQYNEYIELNHADHKLHDYIRDMKDKLLILKNSTVWQSDLSLVNNTVCTAMLVNLMFQYQWVSIDCDRRFANIDVLCEHNLWTNQSVNPQNQDRGNDFCLNNYIYIKNYCWIISKARYNISLIETFLPKVAIQLLSSWAIGVVNRNVIGMSQGNSSGKIQCVTSEHAPRVYLLTWLVGICDANKVNYYIHQVLPSTKTSGCNSVTHFSCRDNECILNAYLCDGVAQCKWGEDEEKCAEMCHGQKDCSNCTRGQCNCEILHFQCFSGGCVSLQFKCNSVADCSDNSDERECFSYAADAIEVPVSTDINMYLDSWLTQCPDGWALCSQSHEQMCYPIDKWCTYITYKGIPLYCPDLDQTHFCDGFECPTMFKCESTYCISTYMVCDGVHDCPTKEDEETCADMRCPGSLRCTQEDLCVHPEDICDGFVNCLLSRDDELFCDAWHCPVGCQCRGYIVFCQNSLPILHTIPITTRSLVLIGQSIRDSFSLKHLYNLNTMIIKNSTFFTFSLNVRTFSNLTSLFRVSLTNCAIITIQKGAFRDQSKLKYLDLSGNRITILLSHTFMGMTSLVMLPLNNLQIQNLKSCCFCALPRVSHLNLSFNDISVVSENVLETLEQLQVVDLTDNPIIYIAQDVSVSATSQLLVDRAVYCCYTNSPASCASYNNIQYNHQLCTNIIDNHFLMIWSTASTSGMLLVNVVALLHEWGRTGVHAYLAKLIIFTDSISLIYSAVLSFVALLYHNNFIFSQSTWPISFVCKMLSKIVPFSFMASKMITLVSVINQVLGTKYALSKQQLSSNRVMYMVLFIWLFSLTFVFIDWIWERVENIHLTCFPYSYVFVTRLSLFHFALYFVLTLLITIVTSVLYLVIVFAVSESASKFQIKRARLIQSKLTRKICSLIFIEFILWLLFAVVCSLAQFNETKMSRTTSTILQLLTVYMISSSHSLYRIGMSLLSKLSEK